MLTVGVKLIGLIFHLKHLAGTAFQDISLLRLWSIYLIDNIYYVYVGDRVYRQCVGIPMGTDCAPLLDDLFLFYYEYEYMKDLIKNEKALKCKPSALIFGRGRAKELLHVRDDLRKRTR